MSQDDSLNLNPENETFDESNDKEQSVVITPSEVNKRGRSRGRGRSSRGTGSVRGRGRERGRGRGRGRSKSVVDGGVGKGAEQGSARGGRGRGRGQRKPTVDSSKKKKDGNPDWKTVSDNFINTNADVEFVEYTGPSRQAKVPETPLQFLQLFFSDAIFEQLAEQTNLYFEYLKEQSTKKLDFVKTNVAEIKAYLGIIIAMGMGKLPTYSDYWKKGVTNMQWFSSIMTRNRFQKLSTYFHLVDNKTAVNKDDPKYSKLFKLGGLESKICKAFFENYHPGQDLSIDEQMIGMKGRVSFIQYMPKKPKKFGIKIWACCDAESSYCLRFQIYTGASESGAEQGLASRVVFDLMEPYLDKAYHLYVDNFYTALKLLQDLEKRKTYACGTVRINRGEFPQSFKEAKLEVGDSIFIRINNILAVHWKDKRDVFVMSSIHGNGEDMIQRYKGEISKPTMIGAYNMKMGGVDKCDQRLSYYSLNRKSFKWWKKVFFRLFEMSIVNSLVLFTHKYPEFTKKRSSHKKFREMLVHELVQPLLDQRAAAFVEVKGRPAQPKSIPKQKVDPNIRLTGKHFRKTRNPRSKCCVCAYKINPKTGKRFDKKTVDYCYKCEKYVCENCFEDFHTKSNI